MEKIKEIFNNETFLHHAYGFESHGLKVADFEKFIDRNRFSYIFSRHYDFLKIDDVRKIKQLQSQKTEKESLFVISFTHINNESQNALLKIIEEPGPNTIFFFIFPNAKNLLSTVLSRMEILSLNRVLNETNRKIDAVMFVEMKLSERFDLIKEITNKNNKNDNIFLKSDLQNILDDLEILFIKQKPSKKRNNVLEVILKGREYMNSNSASLKMILDMVAISLKNT